MYANPQTLLEPLAILPGPGRERGHDRMRRESTSDCSAHQSDQSIEDPDRTLALRAARGDHQAFTEIVNGYAGRVRSVALRMLRDPAEAEDLAQEVFVSVYCALPNFRCEAKLSTWILRIARNHCLNRIKASRRRYSGSDQLKQDAQSLEVLPGVVKQTADPAARVLSQELRGQIEAAIAELPPTQRWLVVLRDIEGLSYEEIADVTDLKIGTVKSRLHRARERLAISLREVIRPAGRSRS